MILLLVDTISLLLVQVMLLQCWCYIPIVSSSGNDQQGVQEQTIITTKLQQQQQQQSRNGMLKEFSKDTLKQMDHIDLLSKNSEARRILDSGNAYTTQIQHDDTTIVNLVIQDIRAPTDTVWGTILDFNKYHEIISNGFYESQIYKSQYIDNDNNNYKRKNQTRNKKNDVQEKRQQNFYVRQVVGTNPFVLKSQYYLKYYYNPNENLLTWTLDYTKSSDIYDSIGYWYVIPHPDYPTERTRIYHSVHVMMESPSQQQQQQQSNTNFVASLFGFDYTSPRTLSYVTSSIKATSERGIVYESSNTTEVTNSDNFFGDTNDIVQSLTTKVISLVPPEIIHYIVGNNSTKSVFYNLTCSYDENNPVCVGASFPTPKAKLGIKRYALITTIIALSLYNVHLFFSQ